MHFMKFDLSDENEKQSFTDVRDWYENFKPMKCDEHRKGANLILLIDREGSNVSIDACCQNFFREIVGKKKELRRHATVLNEIGSEDRKKSRKR
jgi:hypothetical protein